LGSGAMAAVASRPPLTQGGARYVRVVLGCIEHGSTRRWLTHDEISSGVLNAVDSGASRHVVGALGVSPEP
jgi:hypothetical protein